MRPVPTIPAVRPHVETFQTVQGEVSVARAPSRPVDLAVEGEHQRQGIFGHRIRRIGRHTHHLDAAFPCGLQIDVVEPCAAQGDQSDAVVGHGPDHVPVGIVIDEDADHVRALGQGDVVDIEVALEITDVEPVLFVQRVERGLVIRLGPVKDDVVFHRECFCDCFSRRRGIFSFLSGKGNHSSPNPQREGEK